MDDAKKVATFLKLNIFCRFGGPKAINNDQGSHFCNRIIIGMFQKYEVVNIVSTPYHPQTNGQVEVFNREVKKL